MKRIDLAPITTWITAAAVQNPTGLAAELMRRLDRLGRRGAARLLHRLEAAQWLVREGTPRRVRHRPGALRQVVQRYALEGLQEDLPWRRDFAPYFELPAEVRRMARHAFTELVNNAVDHSDGTAVTVSMRQTPMQLQLLVSDDGCGLFERIENHFAIDEPRQAMLELAKGGLTSQPARHSGRGLVTIAQLADVFDVRANGNGFQRRAWSPTAWHAAPANGTLLGRPGTTVFVAIALDTPRTLDTVQRALSLDAAGHALDVARVPLHLLAGDDAALVSRAEARRAAARLQQFRRAEIDFSGVGEIGHAFADELFRVWRSRHPDLELVTHAAGARVASMLAAVTPPGTP